MQSLKMPKFCANLSFFFTERPFLERYKLAKDAGFTTVESGFPYDLSIEEVVNAKKAAGVSQILLNIYTGDVTKGELGFAAIPGKQTEFQESIVKTIAYAKALGAQKIHIMSGKIDGEPTIAHDQCYETNLKYAVSLLEKENIIGLIEPINKYSVPNYYMNCYKKAVTIIEKIQSSNLKIMLDVFHMQHIRGNISHSLGDFIHHCGHVQIAQVPNRNEPNTDGELNYKYILQELGKLGYNDWIGLEYKPANDCKEGLQWIKEFGYSL